MPQRRKSLKKAGPKIHTVKWDRDRYWRRLELATERLQARQQPVRVTVADVLRLAVDDYLKKDEAAELQQAS